MTKIGRPKKPASKSKSMYIRVRVTPAERAAIMKRWQKAGAKNESVWIRKRLLDDK